MRIESKTIEMVDPKLLKPYDQNRNHHSKEQIERLCKLITYHGFRDPLTVSKRSQMVITGNGTLEASLKLGLEEVPVIYQDFESAEAEYSFSVSHNSIASWSELDLAGINADIPELGPDFDIDLLGLKDFTIDIADKDLSPVSEIDLNEDAKKPIEVECPECNHHFVLEI